MAIVLILILVSPLALMIPRKGGRQVAAEDGGVALNANNLSIIESPWAGGPLDMAKRLEFYLLFICTFAIQSGGLFLTTNTASMVVSRSGKAVEAATAVTIFSSFQGFARLITGIVTDWIVSKGWPRTIYFPILTFIMALAHLILAIEGPAPLLIGTALGGIAFGSVYPLLVIAVAEVFGRARVASNYMVFDGAPGAIGVLIIAKALGGSIYKSHEVCVNGKCECHGDACFRASHFVIVVVQLVVTVLGLVFAKRTQGVYDAISGRTS